MKLKINEEESLYQVKENKEPPYSVQDLSILELPMKEIAANIVQKSSETYKQDNISINLDYTLVDEEGSHKFSFFMKQGAGYSIINGGLFGVPGYSFLSSKFAHLDLNF